MPIRKITALNLPVNMKEIEKTKEFRKFKTTLDKFNDQAIKAVADSVMDMQAKVRLSFLTKQLESALVEVQKIKMIPANDLSGRAKCPPGTTFDPNTGTCI